MPETTLERQLVQRLRPRGEESNIHNNPSSLTSRSETVSDENPPPYTPSQQYPVPRSTFEALSSLAIHGLPTSLFRAIEKNLQPSDLAALSLTSRASLRILGCHSLSISGHA